MQYVEPIADVGGEADEAVRVAHGRLEFVGQSVDRSRGGAHALDLAANRRFHHAEARLETAELGLPAIFPMLGPGASDQFGDQLSEPVQGFRNLAQLGARRVDLVLQSIELSS